MMWNEIDETPGGYRLARLEVFNWGTFNGHWVLETDGRTSLLTGENGSGKSTLVDALLTLLVPSRGTGGRNYNQAAGTGQRAERTERSYVMGAYGQVLDEEGVSQVRYLRNGKPTYSVLLGVFQNDELQKTVSLAQVFSMQGGTLQKFFAVAEQALGFKSHFLTDQSVGRTLKPRLREQGVGVFDHFKDYSAEFRRQFNLGDKALDLFNQIVSIKDIGELNEFVRRHMLEEFDAQTIIARLQDNYQNLTEAHKAIETARKQLGLLEPLLKNVDRHRQQEERLRETQAKNEYLPVYVAWHKDALLAERLSEIERVLASHQQQYQAQSQERERIRSELQQVQQAMASDTTSRRLEELKRDLERLEGELATREKNAEHYAQLVEMALLQPVLNIDDFMANVAVAAGRLSQEEGELGRVETRITEYQLTLRELRQRGEKLESEIQELAGRRSLIPPDELRIRVSLAAALELSEDDFPFVGELLRVRDEHTAWEPAIQRLLSGFGRQMLVPEPYYHQMTEYVEHQNLRGRLVYHRVNQVTPASQQQLGPQSLVHKLLIRPETTFRGWLEAQLIRSFDYTCCETLADFQKAQRAVTLQGQVKHGGERHEKDDRRPLGERRYYVLGWDNQGKIDALRQELDGLGEQMHSTQLEVNQLQQDKQNARVRIEALRDIQRLYDRYEQIDWRETRSALEQVQDQYEALRAAPEAERYQLLEQQLVQLEQERDHNDLALKELGGDIRASEDRHSDYQRQKQKTEDALARHDLDAFWAVFEEINEDRRASFPDPLTLEFLEDVPGALSQFYYTRIQNQMQRMHGMEQEVQKGMLEFKNEYPAETTDVDTSLEAAAWFGQKLEQIKYHDLPQHEKRFKELMHGKVTQSVDTFQSSLKDQRAQYQKRIEHLNQSLHEIPYTGETYIRLLCEHTKDQEIRRFQTELAHCHPDVGLEVEEADEKAFQRIQQLLEKLKTEVNWTRRVTDVRNWLDFSAEELRRADDSHVWLHSSSSGKSGGQKANFSRSRIEDFDG